MKNRRFLAFSIALIMAGTLTFADIALAQCWGDGPRCPGYRATQTGWQGRGPGYANCAYNNYGYCAQGRANYTPGPRGPRRGFRNNYGTSQTAPPAINQ